jgi:hypothetical protein
MIFDKSGRGQRPNLQLTGQCKRIQSKPKTQDNSPGPRLKPTDHQPPQPQSSIVFVANTAGLQMQRFTFEYNS